MTTSIFADRINTYGNQTSAEALFFHSSIYKFVKGLRVLLPDKGLEFSDGSYIGTDPAGFFYYYNLEEVKLFFNFSGKLVGEFLGEDYFGTVDLAGMKGYTHGGQWKTSSANSYVEAHLKKDANSATVTLDISKALKKSARMTTDDTTLKASSILDISGQFHYDSLDNIKNGTYVSYTNDRLVFYQNDKTGTTFSGYYIPNGRSDNITLLGIQGSTELTLKDTEWT